MFGGAPIRLSHAFLAGANATGVVFEDVANMTLPHYATSVVDVLAATGTVMHYSLAVQINVQIGPLPLFFADVKPAVVPLALWTQRDAFPSAETFEWYFYI